MTDAELIARLRSVHTIADCDAAADRIELLEYMNNTLAGAVEQRDAAIEDLEAKLAECEARLGKAVGGLKRVCRQPDYMFPSPQEIARETLAEIKPITEWPEETGNIMVGKMKGESHE